MIHNVRVLLLFMFFAGTLSLLSQPIGYQYGKVITINSAIVSGTTNLTDFPFLFRITDPDLRTTGNGGYVTNSNGYDIMFTDVTCATNLQHEVEKYNPATGELICWVNLPVLNYSVNTTIHIYYGNSTVTVPTSTSSTWNSNYDCVLHLSDNPTSSAPQMKDSSPAARSGTCLGAMTATNSVNGKIGSAIQFDEINDGIEITDFDYTQSFTISFWFYFSEVHGTVYQYLFSHGTFATTNSANIYIGEDTASVASDRKMLKNIFQDSNDGTSTTGLDATNAYVNGFWHYYTFVVGNSGGATVYVDGVQKAYLSYLGGNTYTPTTNIFLGCRNDLNSARFLGGIMDEFRILNVPRSADWVATEYSNQNSPGIYYSVGAQTSASVQCIVLPIELREFKATQHENTILVQWETSSEKNNYLFCLERCADGINFMEIARQLGAINSNKLIKYHHIDHSPLPAGSYYRLKQIDMDGSFNYSKIIYAEFKPSRSKCSLYPNPTNEKVKIQLEHQSFLPNELIKIFDEKGSLVLIKQLSSDEIGPVVEVDLSPLKKGNYLLFIDKPNIEPIKLIIMDE